MSIRNSFMQNGCVTFTSNMLPQLVLSNQRYVYTNQEFLRLSYFDKIEGTERADGQTDGMERLTRPPRDCMTLCGIRHNVLSVIL